MSCKEKRFRIGDVVQALPATARIPYPLGMGVIYELNVAARDGKSILAYGVDFGMRPFSKNESTRCIWGFDEHELVAGTRDASTDSVKRDRRI